MIRSSGRKTKRKQPDSEPDSDSESESERSSTTPETASSYSATTSESGSGSCTDSDQEPSSHLPQLVIINGKLIDSRNKQADQLPHQGAQKQRKYFCHWEGCQKSYTKPVRLEEHVRSHTNERPFGCPTCPAAYRRETHLTAHMRMHLPESSRPLLCGWQAATLASSSSSSTTTTSTASPEACPRRFWTQQQLRIHRENVHEGKKGQPKLRCDHCPQEFLKHRALRAHLLDAHCPQGTKPYMCPHPNCGFSFANPSRLRKHERTHEPNRYTCVHHDCLNNPSLSLQQRSFSSWTDLQRHTRDSHPFRCPEQDCSRNKKPFKSLRSLKQHLQVYHPPAQPHREGEEEEDEPMTAPGILASSARNTGAFICTQYPPCTRAYKSAHTTLNSAPGHPKPTEKNELDGEGSTEKCLFRFNRIYDIQRHLNSHHSLTVDRETLKDFFGVP
ncbi:uncharacterized protein PGTG_15718 [Puccinia graminis f. sp. tritici CRL 75-36-700-3]|uniref:C2H2-type domain-containing protein n=1 Tax=Puccinia graminis f. sp. tritici (strain CRL 75-36-700-3 / race SCCL) TaxID=418459 RepID=E3KZ44_PUCGT|nr:uncharacterized protein PGTG_15718 [Puccinia graminis f. sp. tritici CRL 75-36-700-3]EFP89569.2 hypothetical protein PGTG_15718 [Puccinia graminis f. sp. tritici CRL 75-36-700-3]